MFSIGVGEVALLVDGGDSGVAVVRGIAQYDKNRALLLDVLGVFALFLELLEDGGLGMALGDPAGEGVGEKDSDAVLGRELVREGSVRILK